MWLSEQTFRTVVESTPLVSIDLVIRNREGRILLGRRLNRPAQGFWFVPGGRIQKNEPLDEAFQRITKYELGQVFTRRQARLMGIYEHFYRDSVFGKEEEMPDTHYVVLGYSMFLPDDFNLVPPAIQHSDYRWWRRDEMTSSPEVHEYTQAYVK
ncbi:GDP-mannose mannosyl hydrolase [Halomonas sp. McH1-25]|uniref:GDP-mannose mannosyl hydrolase n=1 Tax=unclassified Halomonas TaxID=2609666 RepID=UPI001EF65422|nr:MULTISPECIES: GDP-mannose mannosyl hydrolase [unclassified Halomonas]MCG7601006.1 GDP-mannose mannosyl hydrolase [Halomonas sp. McH1-25]MCP1342097.1 GDP-mannose mannosyl hydrolase [Halomonas sp. FL8]MCP1360614.1 GDP-mannose mannosyl hydrolase [Halomonas sp. BBD45]MCP1364642.1 GDP-mannose mannosyl hydrolase [Halomonas sp. BBD48]